MSGAEHGPARFGASEALERALDAPDLRVLLSEAFIVFLRAQRWFGGKGRMPSATQIADLVPVEWGGDRAAIVRLVVEWTDGAAASYQLPLVMRTQEEVEQMGSTFRPGTGVVLASTVAEGSAPGVIIDALHDARFRTQLGAALARGARFERAGAAWTLEPVGAGPGDIPELPSRIAEGEQSNTSVIYGDRAILKLFRKLEPGEHPDVEIARFLTTRTGFRNTPELLATIHFRSADGDTCVAGMLSRFLPGATDGWTYALEKLRPYLRASGKGEPPNPFVSDAGRLGAVTRQLHDALASDPTVPGFATEPLTPGDVDRWADEAGTLVDDALDLLTERLPSLDAKVLPMARAIAGRRDAAHSRLDEVAEAARGAAASGRKIRHHGDYHLGQVLRTSDGDWMIIDFEGEPARPLAARRALSAPARDVAGMLRSFAYAAATGAAEVGGLGVNPAVEVRSAHWERAARSAFLSAYGTALDEPLVTLFEIEKVFYELRYELSHRPKWVWIPLRGIAKIF
jgi:trehalose synthase-fused probable maltokinase